MALPCILSKTAVCNRIIKARIQNDMYPLLWVLQFTVGQSASELLLKPGCGDWVILQVITCYALFLKSDWSVVLLFLLK